MKKSITIVLAAIAVSAVFAASDKINIFSGGYLSRMLNVEEIEEITWSGEPDEGAFSEMNVSFKDGGAETFLLDELGTMQWQPSRGDCSATMEVRPRYQSAQLTVTAPDGTYYRISGLPEYMLEEIGADESTWAELLMYNDMEYIYAVAEQLGAPLSSFREDEVFESGNQVRDWFPPVVISDNTPIALVIYTARLEGDEVVPTSDPELIRFTTSTLVVEDVDFAVSADLRSNAVTVKADAPQGYEGKPFYVTMWEKADVEAYGLEALAAQTAMNVENSVYNRLGGDWDKAVSYGHGEATFRNLVIGDQYYAVAFGLDYGIVDTKVKAIPITVPEPEVVDDCMFDVTPVQLSPSEFSLDVRPSQPGTRYAAMLVETSRFNDIYTPSMAISKEIHYLNMMNRIDWSDSEFIFTGDSSLSTHDDVLEGKYLNVGTEYSVLIFGVDADSERTTAIRRVDITPQSAAVSGLSFKVEFSDYSGSGNWSRQLKATVTPSDPEAKYVFAYLPASNPAVDMTQSDQELMQGYADVQGEYLELFTGNLEKTMSFGSEWDSSSSVWVFKKYILMVYGYDGEPTTALYAWEIDAATGEAEPIRAPRESPGLTFGIATGNPDLSSSVTHYLPVTVTPSDPDAKYVFDYLPATNSAVDLSRTDEEFISGYVALQGEYLRLNQGELDKTMSFGSKWDSDASAYTFQPYIMFIFGYDGEATSGLYVYKVDTATCTLEQLRGPGM